MIDEEKVLVFDIDGTICEKKAHNQTYLEVQPKSDIIDKMRAYKRQGFSIILYTSRNMRSYAGNIGKINANTLKTIIEWLDFHKIPYDEIHIGKPWCGFKGFYIDDMTVRPDEFLSFSYDEILVKLKESNKNDHYRYPDGRGRKTI